ncbi:MAG: glycosyltransferase family 4 protein [Vicinamibacterales bacterium]
MKVLVAHDVPAARTGGMSRLMGFIHDRLSACGTAVDYLHHGDLVAREGLRRFLFPIEVAARARARLRAGSPYDILNIHEPSAAAALLSRRYIGQPRIVVTTHGVEQRGWDLFLEEARLGREGPSIKTRFVYPTTRLTQSRFGLRRADHVFCLNDEDRAYLIEALRVREDRVTRIWPAAGPEFAAAAAGREYGPVRRLLFSATWRKNKGIEDLVPAISAILEEHRQVAFIALGAGVGGGAVRDAFPAQLRSRVECVVAGNDREAAAIYASADIFVLPSLFEGTPLTLMEAMASGLPIVTTQVCGMRDAIQDGRNGVLVPIRSPGAVVHALRTLIASEPMRRRLGSTARRDAIEMYSWDRSAATVDAVYKRLCPRLAEQAVS